MDRRAARTKDMIFSAFLEMIVKRGYARVSVQDIVDCANIGRSTFYTHFDHKEDVLESSLVRLFERLYENIADSEKEHMVPVIGIICHIKESSILKQAFEWEFIALKFQEQLQKSILVNQQKSAFKFASTTHALVNSYMLAGSFMSLMRWWISTGMEASPEEVSEHFGHFCNS